MSWEALRAAAEVSKAWPFEEARKLIARVQRTGQREALFETGYGPSGLPHLGTFGEVARTTMVRHAFRALTEDAIKTRLIAFSDDMDGLRKTPDNIPNREMVQAHLGMGSVLHPLAAEPQIDMGALLYTIRRLPEAIGRRLKRFKISMVSRSNRSEDGAAASGAVPTRAGSGVWPRLRNVT